MKIKRLLCVCTAAILLISGIECVAENAVGAVESIEKNASETLVQNVKDTKEAAAAFSFNIEKSGNYAFKTEYIPDIENLNPIAVTVLIDGKEIFEDATLELPRVWSMTSPEIKSDEKGNDIRPNVEAVEGWREWIAYDNNDPASGALSCYLESGEHTLQIITEDSGTYFRSPEFYVPEEIPSYEEYLKLHSDKKYYSGEKISIQAELFHSVNSRFIGPVNENGNPCTQPISPYALKLNTLGGTSWQQLGEEVVWDIGDSISEAGLYYISARFLQNYSNGLDVFRYITINGEVPFKELAAEKFKFDEQWQSDGLGYYIYLAPGDKIAMRCTVGESKAILDKIEKSIDILNDFYSSVTVVTGTTPDAYFDYDIANQVKDFDKMSSLAIENVSELTNLLEEKYTASEAGFTCLYGALRLLKKINSTPRLITGAGRLATLKSYISEMGTLMTTIRNQPLLLDALCLSENEDDALRAEPSFWQDLMFRVKRIVSSYINDYSMVSGGDADNAIKIWVNGGRDQANILNEMILQDFTPKTGIAVDLELVQTSLISANFSGVAPDAVLQRAGTETVDFAMRNALVDISKLDGFDELKNDYVEGAFIPFVYEDGCYGLPETMAFNMMFYRTDILKEIGIEPPTTWNQVINETLPTLSWQGMNMGISAIGACTSLYTNLLYQNGGKLYSDDYMKTALDTDIAYSTLDFATKLYTNYDAPTAYDSMSRFRSGEMPILIESYAFYNTLSYLVPELRGSWEMTAIPGILQQDGNVNNCQSAGITGCFMFKDAEDIDATWEFLKWWTGADTQLEYGIKQEAILGASGRYSPANLKTLSQLPWGKKQLASINEQLETLFFVPQIPGSYYLTRCINNAFQTTVLQSKNSREQLNTWNTQMNLELERKRKEFDYKPAFD